MLARVAPAAVIHLAMFANVTLPTPTPVAVSLFDACAVILTHDARVT